MQCPSLHRAVRTVLPVVTLVFLAMTATSAATVVATFGGFGLYSTVQRDMGDGGGLDGFSFEPRQFIGPGPASTFSVDALEDGLITNESLDGTPALAKDAMDGTGPHAKGLVFGVSRNKQDILAQTPEPPSLALGALGFASLWLARRLKR